MTEDWRNGGFGLYLHWPFCAAKCPYCDFNSHVSREIDTESWRLTYLSEIDRHAALTPGRLLNSIFIGGGTPSLMPPSLIEAILSRIRAHWPFANDIEITLEANPGSVEADRFRAYAAAGINRLSLGVQALNDRDLQRLGRIHSASEALAAFDIARAHFDRVSFDLIYARQDQTAAEWQAELGRALDLAVDHLSLYQLTIEPGTAFADRARHGGLRGLPSEDLAADLYELTQSMAGAAGFTSYEVSNLARPGAQSRHNSVYWRYGDYIGIGPGAHGRLSLDGQRHATEALRMPGDWLNGVKSGRPEREVALLTSRDQAEEFLLMGLRLSEGIAPSRFAALSGQPLSLQRVEELVRIGMLAQGPDRISATAEGRLVLNAVLAELVRDLR
ncbi:radical SAM family heme chaperone HemW [Pseudooceanicola sp.]|uniref:radical SAM family heme chaperone HemW n=1 Tax=Pseudooceanicola sp. TaxID=1914328 RepID=UPI00261739F8|nr:radical SAM family heme chaperone HemW [Pseudooceanicola sp.]MDF1854959.1 radical SAM family heme chaperone HemW [Pseudooceanicola sp.]